MNTFPIKILYALFLVAAFCLFAPAKGVAQVSILWKAPMPRGSIDNTPAIAPDGTMYQPCFNGLLLAVTSEGETAWQFKAGMEIESSPAIGADGTIYFGSRDRKFYAVTPAGKLKWMFATSAWNDSSPAIATDGTVYFGSWDKAFYALNPDGSLKWKFATGGIIDSSPAIGADGTIYFGSHDKKFYALSPDGKMKWSFVTGSQITSSPAINSQGDIYFTSTDGKLYAVRPDGSERWHLLTGGATRSSPVLDSQGTIYLGANGLCLAVSPDGKKLWDQNLWLWIEGAPAVSDSLIYFTARNHCLTALTTNGVVAWWFDLDNDPIASAPTLGKDGTIYIPYNNHLNALTPTNATPPATSPWPMFRANAEHTGRVNSN